MKYFSYIIIFLTLTTKAQTGALKKVPDDVKHHYAAVFTGVGTGILVKKVFKANNIVCGIAAGAAGVGITLLKENWWDGKLGRGVKSQQDKGNGFWGSGCSAFYVTAGYTIKESRQAEIDTLNFQFMNKIKSDTLSNYDTGSRKETR